MSMWRNDTKCKYMFMFPLKNLAHKGLTLRDNKNSTMMSHEHHSVSNHWQHDCLFNHWLRLTSKNTSCYRPFVRGINGCQWFPSHIGPVTQKAFWCHDVIMTSPLIFSSLSYDAGWPRMNNNCIYHHNFFRFKLKNSYKIIMITIG